MSSWEAVNKLETFAYKVSNAADALELMALDISEDPHSGAIWFVRDSLKALVEKAEEDIEAFYRERMEEIKPKPKKKKSK